MMQIHVKKLKPTARIPTKKPGDAAYDLYAAESWCLFPGETRIISTGLAMQLPATHYARVLNFQPPDERSGLATKGIGVLGGIIDPHYRGDYGVILHNHSSRKHDICVGDRIAQMVLQRFEEAEFLEASELSETERGEKGFGSSGA